MPFFTTVLQRQVNDVWRKRIKEADAQMRIHTTGKEIRDFLNDRSTLCTVGFIIRRYLQTNLPALLDSIAEATGYYYEDLLKNLNIPWSEEFNYALAKELHILSKKRQITISRNTWMAYLDDAPIKMYKDSPFKVAFSLSMDVDTTEELLMACGQDTYCFRNPEHFIYYYCQSRPSSYQWDHAQTLISNYRNGLLRNNYTANDASTGMTNILRHDLKKLFTSAQPDSVVDEELIQYMIQNQKEFSSLSLTAREDFLRIAKYLSILYPTYSKLVTTKEAYSDDFTAEAIEVPVLTLENGAPKLSDLVRALFNTGGWLSTTIGILPSDKSSRSIRTASSLRRRESSSNIEFRRAEIDEKYDRPFLNSVQYFVDSYTHHLDAIERVFRRPANPGNVERRDVILFTYFFIRRYPELLADEEFYGDELDQLTALAYEDQRIDICMDNLMEELYNLYLKKEASLESSDFDEGADTPDYINLFNHVLHHFGMKDIYLPNPWDRFIIMSLFAEDPDFVTEAILWNTVPDEDNEPNVDTEETEITEDLKLHAQNPVPISIAVRYPLATPSHVNSQGKKIYRSAFLLQINTGVKIPINKSCFVCGRKSNSTSHTLQDYGFQTNRKSISRCHAMILYSNNEFYLADISSTQDTRLNDFHVEGNTVHLSPSETVFVQNAYLLKSNDRLVLGDEPFLFQLME